MTSRISTLKELCLTKILSEHPEIGEISKLPKEIHGNLLRFGNLTRFEILKDEWRELYDFYVSEKVLFRDVILTGNQILELNKPKEFFAQLKRIELEIYDEKVLSLLSEDCVVEIVVKDFTLEQINHISQSKFLNFGGCEWFQVNMFAFLKKVLEIKMSPQYLCQDFFEAPMYSQLIKLLLVGNRVGKFLGEPSVRSIEDLLKYVTSPLCRRLNLLNFSEFFGVGNLQRENVINFITKLPPKLEHVQFAELSQLTFLAGKQIASFMDRFDHLIKFSSYCVNIISEYLCVFLQRNKTLKYCNISKNSSKLGAAFLNQIGQSVCLSDFRINQTNIQLSNSCSIELPKKIAPISIFMSDLKLNSFKYFLSFFKNRFILKLTLDNLNLFKESFGHIFSCSNIGCLELNQIQFYIFTEKNRLVLAPLKDVKIIEPINLTSVAVDMILKSGSRKIMIQMKKLPDFNYQFIDALYESQIRFDQEVILELKLPLEFWRKIDISLLEDEHKLERRKQFYVKNCLVRNNLRIIILNF